MAQVLYMRTELAHREVKQNMCAAVSQGKKEKEDAGSIGPGPHSKLTS